MTAIGSSIHAYAAACAVGGWLAPKDGQHARERMAEVIGATGDLRMRFPRERCDGYVLLCPDAARPHKEWRDWDALTDALRARGYEVRRCGRADGSLLDLINQIAHAGLVIGVDSAPVHIADLLSVPAIGLYAATSAATYGPYCDRSLCIDKHREASDALGLGYNSAKHLPAEAMDRISVDDVLAKVTEWANG